MSHAKNLNTIVEARIHPAIGIARVGNAEREGNVKDYFFGPEVPNPAPPPRHGYRDSKGRLRRQAARFRIYGYNRNGKVVGEITDADAVVKWRVHVANKKASWYNFDVALDLPEAKSVRSARRNSHIQGADRAQLLIDPGHRCVHIGRRSASFDTGAFFGVPVKLGEIHYLKGGQLLFLGGRGVSAAASPEYTLTTFANNAGWHDDTSDGPVEARVWIGGREIPVDPAWVVTAPPNYAPNLVGSQPLYDVILDALLGLLPRSGPPSFQRDILPIFRQFVDSQWVNAGFAAQFGWHGLVDFARLEFLEKLAIGRISATVDPFRELRRQVFYAFRDPGSKTFDPLRWPPLYGDAFGFAGEPPSPRAAFTITNRSYANLRSWMQGDFLSDYDPFAAEPQSLDEVQPEEERPGTLDHAALHFCEGGPFHPGCEMTWIMRRGSLYRSKFRLRRRLPQTADADYGDYLTADLALADGGPLSASGPGDITKWLPVPWQADAASCLAGYPGTEFPADEFIPAFWPSKVPNTVLTEENYQIVVDRKQDDAARLEAFQKREKWIDHLHPQSPYLAQITAMVHGFDKMGILERREKDLKDEFPAVMYVQTFHHPKD